MVSTPLGKNQVTYLDFNAPECLEFAEESGCPMKNQNHANFVIPTVVVIMVIINLPRVKLQLKIAKEQTGRCITKSITVREKTIQFIFANTYHREGSYADVCVAGQ